MSNFTAVQEKATRLAMALPEQVKKGEITNDRLELTESYGSSFLLFEYCSKDPIRGYYDI